MNERIRELALQAELYFDVNGKPYPRAVSAEECEKAYEKFALLMLQDCVTAMEEMHRFARMPVARQIEEATIQDCIRAVREQFGVDS